MLTIGFFCMLLLTVCSGANYNWSVYLMSNDTYCQEVQPLTCLTCHGLSYKFSCEDLPPYYNYWSDGITTASPCRVSLYTPGCKEFSGALQIQAYSSKEDICSDMEKIYDGSYCWFGATSPLYSPIPTSDIWYTIGILVGAIIICCGCGVFVIYYLEKTQRINIFKRKRYPEEVQLNI